MPEDESKTQAPEQQDADGSGKEPEKGAEEKKFTQAELDAEIAKRLARKEEQQKKAAEEAETERKRLEAEAAGKWEEVNKQLKAQVASLEAEKMKAETEARRMRVATKKGIPLALASRLTGETEDAMEADADVFLAGLPKPEETKKPTPTGTPNNPPPRGTSAGADADRAAIAAQLAMTSRI